MFSSADIHLQMLNKHSSPTHSEHPIQQPHHSCIQTHPAKRESARQCKLKGHSWHPRQTLSWSSCLEIGLLRTAPTIYVVAKLSKQHNLFLEMRKTIRIARFIQPKFQFASRGKRKISFVIEPKRYVRCKRASHSSHRHASAVATAEITQTHFPT